MTEPDFSGKFWFCQFCAKRAKNGPKIGLLHFSKKLSLEMFVLRVLKSNILWFSIILSKLHVWEKSGSRVTDWNALGQLDCSIFQIWISQEPVDHLR